VKYSSRIEPIKPSATLAVTSRAKALKAQGEDVVSFGAGEPDFETPPHIVDAMVNAARTGATRYMPVAGYPPLREAVADQLGDIYGVPFTSDEVIVSVGGKHALYNLFQVLVDPGDEVIVPAPYWVSYPPQIQLAGGNPVIVQSRLDEAFRVAPEDIATRITERTVGIVINSPNNPTGAVQSERDLLGLADLAVAHDLWIITDDIYSYVRYDSGPFANVLRLRPDLRERIIVVHGASKTYAMTGWRIGFTLGPAALIRKLSTLQGQSTSNPTAFAQHGALAAITGDHDFLDTWLSAYAARREVIVEGLNAIDGIRCFSPGGAFYVFPDVRGLLGRRLDDEVITDDLTLCQLLLEHALVACVPGQPFGAPGFMRMSYACGMDDIKRGLERIGEFVNRLSLP
jgi:aspartate aminotransferase